MIWWREEPVDFLIKEDRRVEAIKLLKKLFKVPVGEKIESENSEGDSEFTC